jgi:hypothetical protein
MSDTQNPRHKQLLTQNLFSLSLFHFLTLFLFELKTYIRKEQKKENVYSENKQ